jgi:hypothetical protein
MRVIRDDASHQQHQLNSYLKESYASSNSAARAIAAAYRQALSHT